MELTVAVVVQLQRQVRAFPSPDHRLQPGLQGVVLRREQRVGGLVPVAVQVLAPQVEARPAARDAVLVGHRQHVDAVPLEVPLRLVVALQQPVDQSLDDPVAAGLPGVRPRPEEDPVRRVGTADPDDFQPAPLDRLADRQ